MLQGMSCQTFLYSAVNIVMAVYRDRNDFVNTTVAGGVDTVDNSTTQMRKQTTD